MTVPVAGPAPAAPDAPGTDRPGTDQPGTDQPGTDRPGTDRPGTDRPGADRPGAKPMLEPPQSGAVLVTMWLFVVVPFAALLAAAPVAWGWGLSAVDLAIFAVGYLVACLGVTVGFHRYLTHGAFKATRWLRVALAVAGSLAIEGSVTQWVADHRRHHAFADRDGDPHSPWRYGSDVRGLTRGMFFAHVGWLLKREASNRERFAPDLLADPDIRRVDRHSLALIIFSLGAPAAAGGLLTWSWPGVLTGFFWGGLVRVALLHHVTWSINSVCHVVGRRPFRTRDRAANFWPLALLSFGESWHNSHHADPTCARHGVQRGQIDGSARVIWLFERFGWVHDVRWSKSGRPPADADRSAPQVGPVSTDRVLTARHS
ncbi:MAG TPA: fatty acid desaturase [Mycobacteriales bacterium]|nr:fatty acid desaturase [Mycobacteriales bacterium]